MCCIRAGASLDASGFPSCMEKLQSRSPIADTLHRNQPHGRLSVASKNLIIASLGPPYQLGQLPFGIAYRNLHTAFPLRRITPSQFGPNDGPRQGGTPCCRHCGTFAVFTRKLARRAGSFTTTLLPTASFSPWASTISVALHSLTARPMRSKLPQPAAMCRAEMEYCRPRGRHPVEQSEQHVHHLQHILASGSLVAIVFSFDQTTIDRGLTNWGTFPSSYSFEGNG